MLLVLELLCYDYMFQPTFRWFLIAWSVFNRILDYGLHPVYPIPTVGTGAANWLSLPSPSTLILKKWIDVKSDEILFHFRMRDVLSEPDVGPATWRESRSARHARSGSVP
jgi:hypothetical protein